MIFPLTELIMITTVNNANAHDFRAMDQQRSSAFDNAIAHAIDLKILATDTFD